jgi:flagellar biosynthesis component FlhA
MAIASLSNLRRDISKIEFSGLSLPFLVLLIILMLILPLPVFMLGFFVHL